MRAWRLTQPGPITDSPLRLEQVPLPQPGAGEVQVRVLPCGVCRTDLHVVEGELPVRAPSMTPGHQVVGEVSAAGPALPGVTMPAVGTRVGVAWLHSACGLCRFCRSGRENLCERATFTGWTVPGGYAEYLLADAAFVYELPATLEPVSAAPLLCAGIIGYRCLRQCGLDDHWVGARLGIYGFGAAGHVAIQVARARGADVYVATRGERHRQLAEELGARWVGDAADVPPAKLDAAIMFAPAGELVPVALAALDAGGTLVLGGIHMSPIPELDYALLYRERGLRSVANNTRADGRAFLAEAARIPVRTQVQPFDFKDANLALQALKQDRIGGAGVLVMTQGPE